MLPVQEHLQHMLHGSTAAQAATCTCSAATAATAAIAAAVAAACALRTAPPCSSTWPTTAAAAASCSWLPTSLLQSTLQLLLLLLWMLREQLLQHDCPCGTTELEGYSSQQWCQPRAVRESLPHLLQEAVTAHAVYADLHNIAGREPLPLLDTTTRRHQKTRASACHALCCRGCITRWLLVLQLQQLLLLLAVVVLS